MADFLVVTAPGASLGFRCAGLECREIGEGTDITAFILGLQAEAAWGLVAMDERFLARVPDAVMKRIRKKGLPIIVPVNIPERWGEAGYEESPVVRLIRKAIGYQIKLKR